MIGRKRTVGEQAEHDACRLLRKHGLKIRERNYRTKRGEIDIIAEDGSTLVFVEVRLRSNSTYGGPAESITPRKQQRIIYASQHYLQKERIADSQSCRFDTICITAQSYISAQSKSATVDAEWIKDAFSGGDGW